jgi:hypothetical protein
VAFDQMGDKYLPIWDYQLIFGDIMQMNQGIKNSN